MFGLFLWTLISFCIFFELVRCGEVTHDWQCPSDYPTNAINILQNPSFEIPSTINVGSAQNWLDVSTIGNGGSYSTSNPGNAHTGSSLQVWRSNLQMIPHVIEYRDVDAISGGPSSALPFQPYLFSFWVKGSGVLGNAYLRFTWNGATIQDDATFVVLNQPYQRYCVPLALIGAPSNLLRFGGWTGVTQFYIDDVALVPYGVVSYTTTISSTIANPTISTSTVATTTITSFTTTVTIADQTITSTPTVTTTSPPVILPTRTTTTVTTTLPPSTVTSSTLPCTQAHLTFSSACCPRSYCKAAVTAHRRSPSSNNIRDANNKGDPVKRDVIDAGVTTISLTGAAPTVTIPGTSTITISTVTTSTTATSTISTASTTHIPSTTVTATTTSTITLPAMTVYTTTSTSTSTSTSTPPASTASACKKVVNVPPFQCIGGMRQQALLSAFELALLKEYKALAPKAFPTILVSCQGDPTQYVY